MKTILDFQKKKANGQKITMITCYDSSFAQLISQSQVDAILVGDSLAQVMHGHKTTLQASTNLMALHTAAVVRAASGQFVVADMPFMSTRKGLKNSMDQVEKLMKAGANAIKIEGADGHIQLIQHIVESGVPVMGHLGLTPQSIHQLGGPKIQGKNEAAALKISNDALALQKAGCFSLVLECVPTSLASHITSQLSIPTIGIGAGAETDGQILVLQDMLGMNKNFNPKFLKKFMEGADLITEALNSYVTEVQTKKFPTKEQSYE
ncbi:MAG: 3-methyl-2-oxobutanoate hydroxymethyltransferase [Bdellovibrionaceae bacterium]|nr:3-methyl-2-oxobutanoate hydroxymethyltransferase [Bdellovibrio sp.]